MNESTLQAQASSEANPGEAWLSTMVLCALLVSLYLTSFYSYTLFHSFAELFSVVIAFGIFVVAWNARAFLGNNYLLFIGIAYLFIGGIDLIHTLAYKGMGVFKIYDANHPTQLWIAARSLQAVSLLLAPFFIDRRMNRRVLLTVYAAVFSLLLWSILWADLFPDCFLEGDGLTPFKKACEYVISAVLVAAGILLLRKKNAFEGRILRLLLISIAATILSELAFTFYVGVYDLSNLIGHIFKIIAFYAIYEAIIKTGLRDPYELIFRHLQQSRTELELAGKELELRVKDRTRELVRSNELYRQEIGERKKAEEALRLSGAYNRSLIESSLDPLVTIGIDGRISDVNNATEEVTGRPRTELIGTDFSDYFTEPDKARAGYQQVFYTGQVRDYPLEIKGRDGHLTPVLYNATVYRNAAGEVGGVFAAARDITERRRAEEETRLNLERQKASLELYQKMASMPVPDIISFVVDKCVTLTGSAIGFVGIISDDDQYMEAHLWSEKAMEACTIGKPLNFPLKDAGIWAEPIRQRRAMLVNDYGAPNPLKKGYPQGHLELSRFMGAPVVDKGRVVAVAGVANKRADYSEYDQNKISLLLEGMWDLIKRKKAEEDLRLVSAYNRTLIEANLDPLVTIGQDGKITDVNDATEKVTGRSRTELVGTDFSEYFTEPDKARAGYQEAFRSGVVRDYPLDIRHKDGTLVSVLYNATVYRDDSGKILGVFAAARDITERKRAEESLRSSEEQLRAIFDNALDGILLADIETRKFSTGNGRICHMLGYRLEELLQLGVNEIHPPESLPFVLSQFEKQSRNELQIAAGLPVRKKDGSLFYADVNSAPVTIGGRKYLLGIFRDMTERRKSEKALLASEQRFKHLVESVTDYIFTVTVENGRPVSTSHGPGCVAITGYTADEYAADPSLWYRMIYEEDRKTVVEQSENILTKKTPVTAVDHRIYHKKGSIRWVKHTLVPRYDENGVLLSYDGLIADITDRKLLEEQLRQAQKMEAIGQLAGGIAHDFNNILSAIIGYGHILHMKLKECDPLRVNVEHMLESADRAAHLTHSLLAFSRKQIINPADVDLNEAIPRIEKFLRRIIGEDIELKTVLKKDRITVHADSSQLEQMFMNLATNARDAMEHGGCLSIEADHVQLDEMYIRSHGYGEPGWYALISMEDTGRGMDRETQKRIFEPFFTTKEPGKGTGLGLAMVYGIVKQHNGYINVYSEPGKGTIFRIYLPLVMESVEKKPLVTVPATKELPRGSETILLAEDDAALRTLFSTILADSGYHVIEAADGAEAVSLFTRNAGTVDLLVLDMIMPKKSGSDAYEEIHRIRADIKTIFMSGYTADKVFTSDLREKNEELLLKPISPSDFVKRVRMVLDRV